VKGLVAVQERMRKMREIESRRFILHMAQNLDQCLVR
jgi:hypothetical protein